MDEFDSWMKFLCSIDEDAPKNEKVMATKNDVRKFLRD